MEYLNYVQEEDPAVAEAIANEIKRLEDNIELIASENVVSKAVVAAQGCEMTNKYAEGYPGRRYYGGCANVDVVENLAIERAKALFGAEHANVQPHSGSQANTAVYLALLKPGDKVLGMNLNHGGHLTHGNPFNISGILYNFSSYGVEKETEVIDYDKAATIALAEKPKMIVAGASAYPRIIDFARMREIADSVGAYLMVDMAHIAGLVAAGVHPNPVPHAHVVTTTSHKTLRGPRGGIILCQEKFAAQIDKAIFPGIQGGPLMHVIAAKAVALHEAQKPSFVEYQKQIVKNTRALGKALEPYGFRLVSGGSDNHLLLVDLRNKKVTGKEAEVLLDEARITANKNMIPFDPLPPHTTSGLRLGTAAVTTRGLREEDMSTIAQAIDLAINRQRAAALAMIDQLTKKYPLFK